MRRSKKPDTVTVPKVRLDWLRRKHEKALAEYHFANGYRAGLEAALLGVEKGRDLIGDSIDDGKAAIR